jgi:O-6-methylguanine DNA methyltransferase
MQHHDNAKSVVGNGSPSGVETRIAAPASPIVSPRVLGCGVLRAPEPLGAIELSWSATGLVSLVFVGAADVTRTDVDAVPPEYARPLARYFAGDRVDPAREIPIDLEGTPFQRRVWAAVRRIPRGQVRTYASIASEVGAPRALRAVGAANARNRLAIVVPCHRVVASGLELGGYGPGLPRKRALLALEGVEVRGDRVIAGQLGLLG